MNLRFIKYSNLSSASRNYFTRASKILGIETSCDDTGCGIVNHEGKILGEALNSQQNIHLLHGGILPPLARDLHKSNIETVVSDALRNASLDWDDIDAIATTVKPGLSLSLLVGMEYGKNLSRKYNKPYIPVHHMEAHALTARLVEKVDFPFLVLLISGGHCIIALVQNVDQFYTLGSSLDDAPGEAFDKISRRLKMINLDEFQDMSGGRAIELAARKGNPLAFRIAEPLTHSKDCNFSFAGIKNSARIFLLAEEKKFGIEADAVIPTLYDFCASVQLAITKHLCRRLQRAMTYCVSNDLLPQECPRLVVSGGVSSNEFIRKAIGHLADSLGFTLYVPPARLCTDNGVMIAWNGMERWQTNKGVFTSEELDQIDIEPKCPLGEDISLKVIDAAIKCKWVQFKNIL